MDITVKCLADAAILSGKKYSNITRNNFYLVVGENDGEYKIIDDKLTEQKFSKLRFVEVTKMLELQNLLRKYFISATNNRLYVLNYLMQVDKATAKEMYDMSRVNKMSIYNATRELIEAGLVKAKVINYEKHFSINKRKFKVK